MSLQTVRIHVCIQLRLFFILALLCLSPSFSMSTSSSSGTGKDSLSPPKTNTQNTVVSSCVCGSLSLQVQGVTLQTPTVDCHCPKCRHYHVAGFASYVKVPAGSVAWVGDTKATHRDSCNEVGAVDRIYCSTCRTKMASSLVSEDTQTNTTNNDDDDILVNLGPIEDDTVDDKIWIDWQSSRKPWQLESKPTWPTAKANFEELDYEEHPSMLNVKGGCGCGASTYEINNGPPSELQHCYCRLCRQFSGSAFQTWIPVPHEFFQWTSPEPELVRTTGHGSRHMCGTCGGVLTIVYDEDDSTIWPAAGGLDDETLPKTQGDMSNYLERVCHICCIWKQNWYKLPKDGNERIDYAA